MILSINLKRWSSQVVHCCTRLTVGLMIHTKSQWKTQRSCRWAIIYIPRGIFFFIHTLHWVSSLSPRSWLLKAFLWSPPVSTWYCLEGFHIQPSYMIPWKNWICECTKWCSHVATQEVSSQHKKTLSWTTSYEKMCTWDGKMLQDSVQSDPFIYSHIFWRLATNV